MTIGKTHPTLLGTYSSNRKLNSSFVKSYRLQKRSNHSTSHSNFVLISHLTNSWHAFRQTISFLSNLSLINIDNDFSTFCCGKLSRQLFNQATHYRVTVMLLTTLCGWFYDGDRFKILATESLCWRLSVTNILKLSPTHFVSNILHQHRCHPLPCFPTFRWPHGWV